MRFTHLFIDRPILATVLSVFLTLIGLGALAVLPVAQYPEIVPPTVQVTATYPGADAQTLEQSVATPLEEFIFFDHPSGRARIQMAMDWKAAHLPAGNLDAPEPATD